MAIFNAGDKMAEYERLDAPQTPDDMEGRLAKLAAMTTVDPIMLDAYGRCSATFGDLRALLRDYQERGRALEELRDSLLGIALSDRYRRYPKQHEDGGIRGQSGLRAVRALTEQHGSYLTDDDVVRLDKEARATLKGKSHD
jgi:hypothetical protein